MNNKLFYLFFLAHKYHLGHANCADNIKLTYIHIFKMLLFVLVNTPNIIRDAF